MDWERTLPRFAAQLVPDGVLALVEDRAQANRWDTVTGPILARYSMNTDFQPYDLTTIVAALEQRQLFRTEGTSETAPVPFQQSIDDWIESFHARNGFSRDRMDADVAMACDAKLRAAIMPFCPTGVVEQQITARIVWGSPSA